MFSRGSHATYPFVSFPYDPKQLRTYRPLATEAFLVHGINNAVVEYCINLPLLANPNPNPDWVRVS